MNAVPSELVRHRLLKIRTEMRQLMQAEAGRPLRHRAVFYSGTSDRLREFCGWLGRRHPAYVGATNLEQLPAGRFLVGRKDELTSLFGTTDFDRIVSFPLPGGATFSGSINGIWRELSAHYAKVCAGVVHVLVAHDRVHLHRASLDHWSRTGLSKMLPRDLKVFGFVELPILLGLLARNSGVSAVNIYVEETPGAFRILGDGQFIVHPAPARA